MAIFNKIIELNINEVYKTKILGYGEVYEMISVEKKRKKILRKNKEGILFLASNKDHSQKGYTLEDLSTKVSKKGFQILKKGYVDSPPWQSKPCLGEGKKLDCAIKNFSSILCLKFLVLFEGLWSGKKKSHMVYVFGNKK